MLKKKTLGLWIAGALIIALFPGLFGIYYANIFISFAIWALFAVSLNLLLGFTGLLSFGHAMYFGTGAYGTALALVHIDGLTIIPAVLFGFVASMVLAAIIAPLVVRVSGSAFAMLHLAFAQLLYVLALKLRHITGGEDGISIYPRPDLGFFGWQVQMNDLLFFYIAIIIVTLSLCLLWFITKTPFGQIMVGIRDNAKRIDYLGFRVPFAKAIVYVISGGFAGIAGSIYLLLQNLISTNDAYSMVISVFPIMMVMLGGVMSFFGPIYGAALFAVMEEWIGNYTGQFELILGVLLVIVTMYWPLGLAGYINTLRFKWHSRQHQRKPERSAS